MREREPAEVVRTAPQLGLPVLTIGGDHQLVEDEFDDAIQQRSLIGGVAVERHRVPTQLVPKPAAAEGVQAFLVDQPQRGGQHALAGERGLGALGLLGRHVSILHESAFADSVYNVNLRSIYTVETATKPHLATAHW
jgi:hypothetical protein